MTNSSNYFNNSNSRPWDRMDLLGRRKEVVPLLEELGFLALLEMLVVEAQVPVLPTATNWLVQRAMQDGSLVALKAIQSFFDEPLIQQRIEQLIEQEKQVKPTEPRVSPYSKPINPYSAKE